MNEKQPKDQKAKRPKAKRPKTKKRKIGNIKIDKAAIGKAAIGKAKSVKKMVGALREHSATRKTKEFTVVARSGFDSLSPHLSPYWRLARMHSLTGAWLVILPAMWGLGLAVTADATQMSNFLTLLLLVFGGLVARAAGCVWGDIMDRKLDRKVARTASRPLASGELKVWQASVFLAALLVIALLILLAFNTTTIVFALTAIPLFLIYPLGKRFVWWPQVILGLIFGWGVWIGWFATLTDLGLDELIARRGYLGGFGPPLLLHLAVTLWVIGYDTIYSLQDIKDDAKAGVKSMSQKVRPHLKGFVLVCYLLSSLFIILAGLSVPAAGNKIFLLFIFPAILVWQVSRIDPNDPKGSFYIFQSNVFAGLIAWLVLISL